MVEYELSSSECVIEIIRVVCCLFYLLNLREVDSSSKPIKIRIVQAFLDSFMRVLVYDNIINDKSPFFLFNRSSLFFSYIISIFIISISFSTIFTQ